MRPTIEGAIAGPACGLLIGLSPPDTFENLSIRTDARRILTATYVLVCCGWVCMAAVSQVRNGGCYCENRGPGQAALRTHRIGRIYADTWGRYRRTDRGQYANIPYNQKFCGRCDCSSRVCALLWAQFIRFVLRVSVDRGAPTSRSQCFSSVQIGIQGAGT